jgi:hypothetical protein
VLGRRANQDFVAAHAGQTFAEQFRRPAGTIGGFDDDASTKRLGDPRRLSIVGR